MEDYSEGISTRAVELFGSEPFTEQFTSWQEATMQTRQSEVLLRRRLAHDHSIASADADLLDTKVTDFMTWLKGVRSGENLSRIISSEAAKLAHDWLHGSAGQAQARDNMLDFVEERYDQFLLYALRTTLDPGMSEVNEAGIIGDVETIEKRLKIMDHVVSDNVGNLLTVIRNDRSSFKCKSTIVDEGGARIESKHLKVPSFGRVAIGQVFQESINVETVDGDMHIDPYAFVSEQPLIIPGGDFSNVLNWGTRGFVVAVGEIPNEPGFVSTALTSDPSTRDALLRLHDVSVFTARHATELIY